MLRIILSLCFFAIFAFASSCDFSDSKQKDCELDINNPPILLHKFVDDNGESKFGYSACIYDGKLQIDDQDYDVINCSMSESSDGFLTEGIKFTNTLDSNDDINYKLTTDKNIEIKDDNVILRIAGDFIIESGVKINTQNPKNFILEMIEGTNGKSNLILQRGSRLNATAIIMPDGDKSNIQLNTFFGGIYEKDFIDMINQEDQEKRGNMETIINADNIFSINATSSELQDYNGSVVCGPEVNPLDLNNTQYILKQLYRTKDASSDAPNDENSVCDVKEGKCFDNIITYGNVEVDGEDYKITTTKLDILPSYGVFIESGKIYSRDSKDNIKDILPYARFLSQNGGQCEKPNKIAFSQEIIDEYNSKIAQDFKSQSHQDSQEMAQDSTDSTMSESKQDSQIIANNDVESTAQIPQESQESTQNSIMPESQESIESTQDSTESTEITIAQDENALDDGMQKRVDIDDDFLIIDQGNFDKFNKTCNGNTQCLHNALLPYDRMVWNKLSSKNTINSIYVLNLTNDNISVTCDVNDYYGENLNFSYNLSPSNTTGKIDLRFPESNNNQTQITCKSANTTKQTNKINVTPAKFVLNPDFGDSARIPTLKAGKVNIIFKDSQALNLEGEIDNGFNGSLVANADDFTFQQQNKCTSPNKNIFIQEPMKIIFENGKVIDSKTTFMANTITSGKLDINFHLENTDFCTKDDNTSPICINANISKNINVIPYNFMIKTDIVSPYKVSYYGQIDDRGTFKFNPLLDIKLNAVNSDGEVIDINQSCNYGSIQLNLNSDLLVEFKRSVSDRLNSKVNIYLDEFNDKQTANLGVYFGITKINDIYKNSRKIRPSDVVEPQEIQLTDFNFNARLKIGGTFYNYDNLIVYDRLGDDSVPVSVMIARGKIQDSIKNNQQDDSVIMKYKIYCETCDTKLLAKYLNVEDLEMDDPNWYINTQHPSDLYLSDNFIKTDLGIENSNNAFEGRQKIDFVNNKNGTYNVVIDQRPSGFAPYLNYNENFKNVYIPNSFAISINNVDSPVDKPIEVVKETKEEVKEPKPVAKPKPKEKPKPKAESKPKPKSPKSIRLDIED